MSWVVTTQCWNCELNQKCKDGSKMTQAVNDSLDKNNHKGKGSLYMVCSSHRDMYCEDVNR